MLNKRNFMGAAIATVMIGAMGGIQAEAADELKIGYLVAKSGPFVSLAKTNTIAAKMAQDEINAAGGVNGKKIKIIEFDTAGNPGQAVVGLRRLAKDENVLAIIGPFSSGEAKVVFPQADRQAIVSMSMASSAPKLAEKFKFGFRNTTNEGVMVSSVLKTLKNKGYDISSASIAHATDDAISVAVGTKVLPAVLKKNEVPVNDTVTFKYAAFDLSVQTSQLIAKPAPIVAVGAPPEAAIKLVKEMRRQGHQGRIIAGSTIFDIELPARMGAEGIGSVIPTAFYWKRNDDAKAFAAEFTKRAEAEGSNRHAPSQFDASTYSIVKMFAHVMGETKVSGDADKVKEEREAIRAGLQSVKDFNTIEGKITIGADGDALKPVYVMEIDKQGWSLIDTHE